MWKLELSFFSYDNEYCPEKENAADDVSIDPVPQPLKTRAMSLR